MSASPATLNDYLAEKRGAVLARDAHIDAGTPDEAYVFPYFAGKPLNTLTPPEKVELLRIEGHTDSQGSDVANLDLFPAARKLARVEERPGKGIEGVAEDIELAPGVSLMHTPGHTEGSMSVVACADDVTYVIAGDAVPTRDNYERSLPPGINIGPELALASMERISRAGDIIIPGHGEPFPARRER